MASTGAYRQVLQQIFAIPIEEENNNSNVPQTNDNGQNNEEDSMSAFDEFEEDTGNQNQSAPPKNVTDYTEEDVDAEFANF